MHLSRNRCPKLGASLDAVWRCASALHDRVGDDPDALDFALDNDGYDEMPDPIDASETSSAGTESELDNSDLELQSHKSGGLSEDENACAEAGIIFTGDQWELVDPEPEDEWERVRERTVAPLDEPIDPQHVLLDSGAWVNCTGDLGSASSAG